MDNYTYSDEHLSRVLYAVTQIGWTHSQTARIFKVSRGLVSRIAHPKVQEGRTKTRYERLVAAAFDPANPLAGLDIADGKRE
jgi:hypothetical protein